MGPRYLVEDSEPGRSAIVLTYVLGVAVAGFIAFAL